MPSIIIDEQRPTIQVFLVNPARDLYFPINSFESLSCEMGKYGEGTCSLSFYTDATDVDVRDLTADDGFGWGIDIKPSHKLGLTTTLWSGVAITMNLDSKPF